jgi:hypothetical protein
MTDETEVIISASPVPSVRPASAALVAPARRAERITRGEREIV